MPGVPGERPGAGNHLVRGPRMGGRREHPGVRCLPVFPLSPSLSGARPERSPWPNSEFISPARARSASSQPGCARKLRPAATGSAHLMRCEVEALDQQPGLAGVGAYGLDHAAEPGHLGLETRNARIALLGRWLGAWRVLELDPDEALPMPAQESVVAPLVLRDIEREFGREHDTVRYLQACAGIGQVAHGALDGRCTGVELDAGLQEGPDPRRGAIGRCVGHWFDLSSNPSGLREISILTTTGRESDRTRAAINLIRRKTLWLCQNPESARQETRPRRALNPASGVVRGL